MREHDLSHEYWSEVVEAEEEEASYQLDRARRLAADKGPSRGAAVAAARFLASRQNVFTARYSAGAAEDELVGHARDAVDALALERGMAAGWPTDVARARYDVGVARRAYDEALFFLSLPHLFPHAELVVPRESWSRLDEDAVLTLLADGGTGDASGTVADGSHDALDKLVECARESAPDRRADLMRQYLSTWYRSSRKALWWGTRQRALLDPGDLAYMGHWAFEAAAVVELLGIDDSSFRDAPYYPADLVTRPAGP